MKENDIIKLCLTSNLYGRIISNIYSSEEKEEILMNKSNLHVIRMMMYKHSLDFFEAITLFMINLSNMVNSKTTLFFYQFSIFENLINSKYMKKGIKI